MYQSYEKACNILHYKCFNFIFINFQHDTWNTEKNFHTGADRNPDATFIDFGNYFPLSCNSIQHFWTIPLFSLLFPLPLISQAIPIFSCLGKYQLQEWFTLWWYFCLTRTAKGRESSAFIFIIYWIVFTEGGQILSLTWVHSPSCAPRSQGFLRRYSAHNAAIFFCFAWGKG